VRLVQVNYADQNVQAGTATQHPPQELRVQAVFLKRYSPITYSFNCTSSRIVHASCCDALAIVKQSIVPHEMENIFSFTNSIGDVLSKPVAVEPKPAKPDKF